MSGRTIERSRVVPWIVPGQMHPAVAGITYAWLSKGQGPGSAVWSYCVSPAAVKPLALLADLLERVVEAKVEAHFARERTS